MPADPVWFRSTYDNQVSWVWNTVRRMGVQSREVGDVVQEVFLVIHRQGDSYDGTRPIRPWIFGICYHVADRYKRKAHHRREQSGGWDDDVQGQVKLGIDPENAFVEGIDQRRRRDTLARVLLDLDDDKRAVFIAYDIEGFSMPEIAQVVGAPLNTLYSRLRLAREHVTRVFRDQMRMGPSSDAATGRSS